jgi:hypothetical protein
MKVEKSALFCSVVVTLCVALTATFAQGQTSAQKPRLSAKHTVKRAHNLASGTASAMASAAGAAGTPGLPLWTFNVSSDRDGNRYTGVMVGTNPFDEGSGQTNVATQIVPIIFKTHTIGNSVDANGIIATTPGNTTFNPTQADRACLGSRNNNPLRLFQQSPIFRSADFNYGGTDVGRTQTTDAFQRANFWKVIDREDYHVTLGPITNFNPIVIDVPAANGLALATTSLGPPAFCAPMAIVDINLFDLFINNNILPALAPFGVNHGTLPIFLLYNSVLSFGDPTDLANCCILGYHGTGNNDQTQTYSPMDFDSTGLFGVSGLDIATATHEVAEWMDDPFGNNPTPAWGHTGQVGGCQGNLEVGDPLSGTEAPRIVMPNGFTYHLQELAFFSWFYSARSVGVGGWFSDNGTFLTNAGPVCQ